MNKKELIEIYGGKPSDWKRHKNTDGSKGGWVSKCSEVSKCSYICELSVVKNNSRVSNNSRVYNSRVDNSIVSNSRVDNSSVENVQLVSITGTQHGVHWRDGEHIAIGCEVHTLEHWLENYAEIGKNNGYSDDQIEEYKRYIDIMAVSPRPVTNEQSNVQE